MSKINDIQNAILQLEGGRYQNMMDCYLFRRFGYSNITPYGSQTATDKTTKGTPDSYIKNNDGKYIFIMYGTVQSSSYDKIRNDIQDCIDYDKTGIDKSEISEIICCHTSTNISPAQSKNLYELFENITLIGIGELSQDLYFRYQNLAKDFLSISVDTGQILLDDDFVIKYGES